MKTCTCCGLTKSLSEFYPRRDRGPSAARPYCKECSKIKRSAARFALSIAGYESALDVARQWKQKNPEKVKVQKKEWNDKNAEKVRQYAKYSSRKWRLSNLATARARVLASRQKKQDYYKAQLSEWSKNNPAKRNAKYKRYVATRMQAMPIWANNFFIEEIYDLAQIRTKATGIEWHVDHIVPLQSPIVCGLHVEQNLRVITALENRSKGNRHWPDMPLTTTKES